MDRHHDVSGTNGVETRPMVQPEDTIDGSETEENPEKNADRGMLVENAGAYRSTRYIFA